MALDLEDLLDPPYGFGECYETSVVASAHCEAWKKQDDEITVHIRKVGDRHFIHFPTFLRSTNEGILTCNCDVQVDLYYALADETSVFHITNCSNRHFQGAMQIYDQTTQSERIYPAAIDYNLKTGTFRFEPVTNFALNPKSHYSYNVYEVGILPTTIIIDEEGLMRDDEGEPIEEPTEFPDIDMDYEYERYEAPFIDPIPDPEEDPELETTSFAANVCNGVWVDGGEDGKYITTVGFTKKGNRGIVNIQPIVADYTLNGPASIILIKIKESKFVEFFGGYLPTGELGKCRVKTYLKNRTDSVDNFQECDGIVFYLNNSIKVAPDYSYWKYFYSPSTDLGTNKIGLAEAINFEFEIFPLKPEYGDLRAGVAELDVNDLPSTFTTKNYTLQASCIAWETPSKDVQLTFNKNENEGEIIFPKILSPVATSSEAPGVLGIACQTEIEEFFGQLPAGKLASCTVHTFCPNHFFCESCFKDVAGTIYYHDGRLKIVPDVENYHYFFGTKGQDYTYVDSTSVDTGLAQVITINFTIPETAPVYTNYNEGKNTTVDLSNVPKVYDTWRRFKTGASAWKLDLSKGGYIIDDANQWCKFGFSRNENVGKILISPMMGPPRQTSFGQPICVTGCDDFLTSFFDYVPNGKLGEVTASAYIYSKSGDSNIATLTTGVKASLSYYKGRGFMIHIDDSNYPKYKTFFGVDSLVKTDNWGVTSEDVIITFNIPTTDPGEYTGTITSYQPLSEVM